MFDHVFFIYAIMICLASKDFHGFLDINILAPETLGFEKWLFVRSDLRCNLFRFGSLPILGVYLYYSFNFQLLVLGSN